jgi:hypothetical protein
MLTRTDVSMAPIKIRAGQTDIFNWEQYIHNRMGSDTRLEIKDGIVIISYWTDGQGWDDFS